jgi:hypothetical protein
LGVAGDAGADRRIDEGGPAEEDAVAGIFLVVRHPREEFQRCVAGRRPIHPAARLMLEADDAAGGERPAFPGGRGVGNDGFERLVDRRDRQAEPAREVGGRFNEADVAELEGVGEPAELVGFDPHAGLLLQGESPPGEVAVALAPEGERRPGGDREDSR